MLQFKDTFLKKLSSVIVQFSLLSPNVNDSYASYVVSLTIVNVNPRRHLMNLVKVPLANLVNVRHNVFVSVVLSHI